MSHKSQYSKSPVAAAVSAALVAPAAVVAQDEGARNSLEEIIVYATKRAEDVQGIPFSVQAIPEQMLKDVGALNTEDYARFIPSVTWINWAGAGNNQIIFRGINTGTDNFIAQASASIYLDEVSLTQTGSQPNVRMMDINRVEALSGPQGTLYGSMAQSGTLRILTNQPDPTKFETSVDAQLSGGSESDMSHSVTGVLNLPLVEDVFAIRIAAQTAEDGGFIDNVLGHTPDGWWGYGIDYGVRSEWGTLDNSAVVEENWNSVDYTAARISARWNINDDWAATVAYNYSKNESQASMDYNPFVGDLQTIAFQKNWRQDEWNLFSLTIEGDLGFAQIVSATSYFDRTYDYEIDGTVYHKYYTAWGCEERPDAAYYYWLWVNPATDMAIYYPKYCIMPGDPTVSPYQIGDALAILQGPEWNSKVAQELRLSHQGEKFDWLVGLYYEESDDNWDAVWAKSTTGNYQDTLSLVFLEDYHGQSFPTATGPYLSSDRTDWTQKAVFGEVTWHINEQWHATVGARWFETDNDKQYLVFNPMSDLDRAHPEGLAPRASHAPGSGGEVVAIGKISEVVPKYTLSWNISDDKMMYATYTEGFRTGGINRSHGNADWTRSYFPQVFNEDVVANREIGAKTRWADNTVQLNVAYFDMRWNDFQFEVLDPSGQPCTPEEPVLCDNPWLKVVGNAGDAHSSGLTADFAWIPSERWNIGANAQWLEAEIDQDVVVNPRAGWRYEVIEKGQDLPNVPDFKGAVWATYTWPVDFLGGGEMFLRGQYTYMGSSETSIIPKGVDSPNPSFTNPSYSLADVRIGLISNDGDWQLDFFVNNLTDERPAVFAGSGNFEWQFSRTGEYDQFHRVYTTRPQEYGVRFTQRWGD
jgi:outer membrane receptor protein involved in Fe transport